MFPPQSCTLPGMSAAFVNVAVPPFDQLFTYWARDCQPKVGDGLFVSFGAQQRFGYVIELVENFETDLEKIKALDPDQHIYCCFDESQLDFFRWTAGYYGESLALTIDTAVPRPVQAKVARYVELAADPEKPPRGRLQRQILEMLKHDGPVNCAVLNKKHSGAASALRALERQCIIRFFDEKETAYQSSEHRAPDWAKRAVELDAPQEAARAALAEAVRNGNFAPMLLHGVTGSGKTEVYIEAVSHARSLGFGSLIIVPEIALTPQLIDRFVARLGSDMAVLHSGMSPRERWNGWCALLEGKVKIALGARSAIFAPVPNLRLIIVDEEHDGSYKQSEGLRYNARDLAVVLAKMKDCPVVLGSATPSLESYYNAGTGKYKYLPLPHRHVSGSKVEVSLVDMNQYKPWDLPSKNVSPELLKALTETLSRNEQAFILYNRRGFASYLQCESCNAVINCPNCSVTLTYHRTSHRLKCHYCDYESVIPQYCPQCAAAENAGKEPGALAQRGGGTEKVFEELQTLFPAATIARLDRDAAAQVWKLKEILETVRNGDTKILVGTQMIAKGHDLPKVTLVGIVDCDVGLHMPDFRAAERVFQLLTQAAGRAGRGEQGGRVILQTRVPRHPSLLRTLEQNYRGFAKAELEQRKSLSYPPFARILRILTSSEEPQIAYNLLSGVSKTAAALIRRNALPVSMLGPCPAPLTRIRGRWRWHLLFKARGVAALHVMLRELKKDPAVRGTKNVRIAYDLDPQEMM